MHGRLITLEGLDGSGKATQTALLCDALKNRTKLRRVSFPDYESESSALIKMYLGGAFGSDPGDVNAYAASSFFAVDRFASYKQHWQRDYLDGALIVADRYSTSNMVFQLSKLPQAEWEPFLSWVRDYEYQKLGLPRPSLTLYLDMPPEVSQALLSVRYHGDDTKKDIHENNAPYLAACRSAGAFAARHEGWRTVLCAQGGRPKAVRQIHSEIMAVILEEFNEYA